MKKSELKQIIKEEIKKIKKPINEVSIKKSDMDNAVWTEFGTRDYKFGIYTDLGEAFSNNNGYYIKAVPGQGIKEKLKKYDLFDDNAEKEIEKIQKSCDKELKEKLFQLSNEFQNKVDSELLKIFNKYNK